MNQSLLLSFTAAITGVRRPLAFLAALVLLALPFPARALEARIAFGHANTYAAGAWTPLRVTLENLPEQPGSGRDFRGHVEVRTSDYRGAVLKHRQAVELPLHSRKLLEFEVMLSSNSTVIVELIDENAGPQIRKEVHPPRGSNAFASLRHSIYVVPTVLILQSPTETFTLPFAFDPAAANIKTVHAGELPRDYRGFDGVRLVVVQGHLSERLRPDQLAALDRWILLGGRLAVVTPRNHQEIRDDPWLAERLPALPAGVLELTLDDLVRGAGESPVLLTRWDVPSEAGSVLWGTPAGPAALVARHGAGAVHALGVDPSGLGPGEMETPVGRSVRALLDYWVLGPGREDLRARHLWSTADLDPGFSDVMLLPNLWVVTLLIVLFVVVVGPLNFLVLRRRRQLELAWATIPGFSILFFAAVYAYGAAAKGGDQHFASSDILHLSPGASEGFLLTSQIQFAPRKTTYELIPPDQGVIIPLNQYYHDPVNLNSFNLGNAFGYSALNAAGASAASVVPTLLRNEAGKMRLQRPVEQWTMQFYQGEAPWRIDGRVDGSVHLRHGQQVDLWFRNDTSMDLEDAVLYVGDEQYPVGKISAGETIDRTVAPSGTIPVNTPQQSVSSGVGAGDFESSADFLIRQGGARVYPHFALQIPQRRARLVAANSGWKNPVRVEPAPDVEKSYGLIEVALPVTWEGDMQLSTKDRLRREVYSIDSLNTQIDHNANSTFCRLRDSSVEVLVGNAWDRTPATFEKGQIAVSFVAYSENLVISAFDYSTGRWTPAYESSGENVSQNAPSLATVPIAETWVNPIDPMVRLRLSAQPKPSSAGARGPGSMFSGNQGVEIISLEASMTLRQGNGEAEPAPFRESVKPQEGILSL